ncbi:hypothetical protein INS90_09455 [Trueperella pecoris]|uniref:CARDB domain-containing protein n=1 Tax=Trueperella pecoris TaxID=2733571 RepID=A0A7M1QZT8_9ACTO|nr:hypothetical protein [Trueperella pecoris]QOR47458.1 hypothetical protein INS90_09455 [Trueperella pecoris]
MTRKLAAFMTFIALLVVGLLAPGVACAVPDEGPADAVVASGEAAGHKAAQDAGSAQQAAPASSNGKSTPRIMVQKFGTTPMPVVAGQDCDVVFTARNMSSTTAVRNIKFSLSGEGGLLPRSGSASVFVDRLAPRQAVDVTMYYTSLPTLEDKPYPLTLTIDYEDGDFTALSATETVAVMVSQPARVDTSAPQVMPAQIARGGEASIVFTVNNLGKSAVSNVKASVDDGQGIWAPETYVGNIAAGQTANVDMIIRGDEVVNGPVKITLSYENSEGKVATLQREVDIAVVEEDLGEVPPMDNDAAVPEPSISWTGVGVGGAGLVALVAVAALLVRNHRKKKDAEAEAESLSYLDPADGLI